MLQVKALVFDYFDQPLLKGIDFSVYPGNLLCLQGKNGSGKTTLLKLMAGLYSPLSGSIEWNQQQIHTDLAAYQRQICYLGHKLGISLQLSARENYFYDLQWQKDESLFFDTVKRLSMVDWLDKPCHQLSQGQRRRVSLLRLWLSKAPIWLLDEPLAALDAATIDALLNCFSAHLNRGGLIVMSSHQSFSPEFEYSRYLL